MSNDHTRKVVQDLLAGRSPLELRELCIDVLKRWHRRHPDVRDLDVRSHLGRELLPLLAARQNTTVNVEDPRGSPSEVFLDDQGLPWMDGFVEFLAWFVHAGFGMPSTLGSNILSLKLTAYGRRFLETEADHPLLPGFVERLVLRCPNLPEEVTALLVDARVCLDHMLMRPAIALMGVGLELVVERVFEDLVRRQIVPVHQASARAAARITAVQNVIDNVLAPPPQQSPSPQLIDDRHAARHACDFANALRRRRNDASHTAPTYGFDDREETEELIVSAGRHLPNLWRLSSESQVRSGNP